MHKFLLSVLLWLILSVPGRAMAAMVSYEFDIDYLDVNITGKPVPAMVIDGNIPGPTIQANLNDTLKITFNNRMDVETSYIGMACSCRTIRMACRT